MAIPWYLGSSNLKGLEKPLQHLKGWKRVLGLAIVVVWLIIGFTLSDGQSIGVMFNIFRSGSKDDVSSFDVP
jgi:hypothetical protein